MSLKDGPSKKITPETVANEGTAYPKIAAVLIEENADRSKSLFWLLSMTACDGGLAAKVIQQVTRQDLPAALATKRPNT